MIKEILNQLLTFDSFDSFAVMMSKAAAEQEEYSTLRQPDLGNAKKKETLLSMGFAEVLIDLVLGDSDSSCQMDELVVRLSGMMDAASASTKDNEKAVSKSTTPSKSSRFDQGNKAVPSSSSSSSSYSTSEAEAAALEWFSSYLEDSEAHSKFVSALQLREAYHQMTKAGQQIPEDRMQWVEMMYKLVEDIKSFCLSGYAEDETTMSSGGHASEAEDLVCRYKVLDETMISLNDFDDKADLTAAESRRMAVLEGIALMGTSDEQYLHSLITRYDQCGNDINGIHRKISLLVSPGGVPREAIEQLYLYLKEQVNSGRYVLFILYYLDHDKTHLCRFLLPFDFNYPLVFL